MLKGSGTVATLLAVLLAGIAPGSGDGCCEEGDREVLIEYIEEYTSAGQTDLPGCEFAAGRMNLEFGQAGFWERRLYKNTSAWESDWKSSSLPGGADASYADARDFAYFCGHGNVGYVRFTTNHTDQYLRSTDARFGDHDLEWVTLDASKTLRLQADLVELDKWYGAFEGIQLLIGWHDSPHDGDTGGEFASWMIDLYMPITLAWFAGACLDQPSGTTQLVMAETLAQLFDYLHGQGPKAPEADHNGTYWVWTNNC